MKKICENQNQRETKWAALETHTKTIESISAVHSGAKELLALQRGLTGERELAGKKYMDDKRLFGAYTAYYFPVSYQQIYHAAQFLREKSKKSVRILDFGSGPGSASSAIIDKIREQNPEIAVELVLMDYSESALSFARDFFRAEYKNIFLHTIRADFQKETVKSALKKAGISGFFDVAVSCHLLNELWKSDENRIAKRTALALDVASVLENDGEMILCEPAILEASRALIAVRDSLLDSGLFPCAPCVRAKKCPALSAGEQHTCHAEFPVVDSGKIAFLAQKAKLDRTSVKMTYFVFRKSFSEENPETENPAANAISGRIVSDAMLNKAGRTRFLVCTGSRRVAVSAKKDDERARALGFFNLRRMDFVRFSLLEERGEAFGIAESTALSVEKAQ